MQSTSRTRAVLAAASALTVLAISAASAQENYESWAVLESPFESTGGGGIIIGEYNPVIVGNKCKTDFTATEPGGKVYYNKVEFDAVPAQGGTLCTNGKWQAADGSASGTTPFRVFIKDGVRRRSP
jgi:hypothetical protein